MRTNAHLLRQLEMCVRNLEVWSTLDLDNVRLPAFSSLSPQQTSAALTNYGQIGSTKPQSHSTASIVRCGKVAVKASNPGYVPLTEKRLRTTLLESTYEETKRSVDRFIQNNQGLMTVVTDGWSNNIRNQHLVNYVLVSDSHPPVLYETVDTTGIAQTGEAIAEEICRVINAVGGPEKVAGVVTDNAANMQRAWGIIERRYPNVYCNGCAAHVLNLLIGDIVRLEEYQSALEGAVEVAKFIRNFQHIRQAFKIILAGEKQQGRPAKMVCLPVETRWYSKIECAKSILLNKNAIKMLSQHGVMDTVAMRRKEKFMDHVNDSLFWSNLKELHDVLKPASVLIGKAESDSTFATDVYKLFLELKADPAYEGKPEVQRAIENRWNFINTESMMWAFFLDPANGGGDKVKFAARDRQELAEFFLFVRQQGGDRQALLNAIDLTSNVWWKSLGCHQFPRFWTVMRRCLAVPASSAASERVWSLFARIHAKKRANLKSETASKLAFIHWNMRLKAVDNELDLQVDSSGSSASDTE